MYYVIFFFALYLWFNKQLFNWANLSNSWSHRNDLVIELGKCKNT